MHQLHEKEKRELKKILDLYNGGGSDDLMIVLDTFLAREEHQTVSDIQRRLKIRGLDYEKSDVEDALDTFCRLGFAQVKSFKGQEPLYEHKHLGDHHDHMICTRCGKVEEFIDPHIEELQNAIARQKGFVPLEHKLEIYGLCSECAQQRGDAAPLSKAEKGERLIVCGCHGGDELQRRLVDMGLNPGVEIEVLGCNEGPVVVACRGSRLALGRGMSDKIMVKPCRKEQGLRGFGRHFGRKRMRRHSSWFGKVNQSDEQ